MFAGRRSSSRHPSAALAVLLLAVYLVFPPSGQGQTEKYEEKKTAADEGRNPFREAYIDPSPSVARADLLACQELGTAVVREPRDLDLERFKRVLTGTWVRELTWNGVVIENNSALYFDFQGPEPSAMMFDQSNLGGGPMLERVLAIRNDPGKLTATPRLTFVDCEYLIVDTYYKVSDDFLFEGLPTSEEALARVPRGKRLQAVWDRMVSARFFRFEREETALATEPGAELLTPSVGGALWQAALQPTTVRGHRGAMLSLDGEYRGAHVSEIGRGASARFVGAESVRFTGSETAQFFMDGDFFVASAGGKNSSDIRETGFPGGWLTDCADFFDLPQPVNWERVVLDPGI